MDFHALRHACAAWLAMAGVSPKAIQTVMRHSAITLTMDVYGRPFSDEASRTVARLSSMLAGVSKLLRAAAGTDDRDLPESAIGGAQQFQQHSGSEGPRTHAMPCGEIETVVLTGEDANPLRVADLGEGLRRNAKVPPQGLEP